MKILVANLGSTSFKYRLYDLGDPGEPLLARGAVERIGSEAAKVVVHSPRGNTEWVGPVPDHATAVQMCLDQLTSPETGVIASAAEVSAIGFKAVHAEGSRGFIASIPRSSTPWMPTRGSAPRTIPPT